MFIYTNCEEAIQLLMDHNEVPQLHVCPTRNTTPPKEVT